MSVDNDISEILRRTKVQDILLLLLRRGDCSQSQVLYSIKGNTSGKLRALEYICLHGLASVRKSDEFPYNKKIYKLTMFGTEIAEFINRAYRYLRGYLLKDRQRWLITIFRMMGKPLCRTEVQKLIFLLRHEYSLNLDESYNFKPYIFGPYSPEVEEDLFELENIGLLHTVDNKRETDFGQVVEWKDYLLTDLGRASARKQKFPPHVLNVYVKLREKFSDFSLESLIKYVYERYPEYTTYSILKGME